jgi:hypothetical protein
VDGGWIFGAGGLVVGVFGAGYAVFSRHRDRQARIKSAVETLVRISEGKRVLWSAYALEEAAISYGSVQDLRQAVVAARAQVPGDEPGAGELDQMKDAAERFCTEFENRYDYEPEPPELQAMIALLRSVYVPVLERLREMFKIPAGHRPGRDRPLMWRDIGEPVAELYLEGPQEDNPPERP